MHTQLVRRAGSAHAAGPPASRHARVDARSPGSRGASNKPTHAGFKGVALSRKEKQAEGEVEHEDEDQGDDDGRGGALAHALGAARGRIAPGAAHCKRQGRQEARQWVEWNYLEAYGRSPNLPWHHPPVAMMVPNTQHLIMEVMTSQELMARMAESRMTLQLTLYTVSARSTLAPMPARAEAHGGSGCRERG